MEMEQLVVVYLVIHVKQMEVVVLKLMPLQEADIHLRDGLQSLMVLMMDITGLDGVEHGNILMVSME